MQQGIVGGAKEELLLMPLMPRHVMGPELHSNVAVLRLMQMEDGARRAERSVLQPMQEF